MPRGLWRRLKDIFSPSGTTSANDLSILATGNQFYPWPLRQSGNQGTFGSCNRCISESCGPSSKSGSVERPVHLRNRNYPRAVLSSRQLSAFNPRALCPTIAYGGCYAVLIFYKQRVRPAYFRGGVNHHHKNARARVRWIALGYPRTGNTRVACFQAFLG